MSNSTTQDVRGRLIAERRRHGPESPIGCLCSNIAEQIANLQEYERPAWATHEMQTLPGMMRRNLERLEQLRAAAM